MVNWLDSKVFTLLEGGLDGLNLRNRVLADNIANADTPGFKRSDVQFEQVLQAALQQKDAGQITLKRTYPHHIAATGMSNTNFVVQDQNTTFRNDGNNVDIEMEMTKLAENTLHYNALASSLSSHLAMLKQVIQG